MVRTLQSGDRRDGPEGLGIVLDNLESVTSSYRLQCLVPTGPAIEVHHHDGPRARGNGLLDQRGVEVVGIDRRLYKNRHQSVVGYGQNRSHIGVRRYDNLVARLHYPPLDIGSQHQPQRIEPVARSHRIAATQVLAQLLLELRHIFAPDIPAALDYLGSDGLHLGHIGLIGPFQREMGIFHS